MMLIFIYFESFFSKGKVYRYKKNIANWLCFKSCWWRKTAIIRFLWACRACSIARYIDILWLLTFAVIIHTTENDFVLRRSNHGDADGFVRQKCLKKCWLLRKLLWIYWKKFVFYGILLENDKKKCLFCFASIKKLWLWYDNSALLVLDFFQLKRLKIFSKD
jgi:hypothetical protein